MKPFAFAVLACLAVACGSSSEENIDSSPQPLVSACSGEYSCFAVDNAARPSRVGVVREGDRCAMGSAKFAADGTMVAGDKEFYKGTWTGDSSKFDYCIDYFGNPLCTHCEAAPPTEAPPEAPSRSESAAPKQQCQGSASSCGSFIPGTCSGQTGCYMHSDYVSTGSYSGYWQNDCRGSAAPCGLFDSESSCKRQGGCYWR